VIPIEIPPLRERREDIRTLIDHFVEKHRQRSGKRIDRVDAGVVEALSGYDWPGNVRELENTIERAVVLATGHGLTTQSISLLGATSAPSSGLPSTRLHQNLEWVERETIRRALEQASGVKKDAAELMGISQRALSYYLAKYRID
jgi:two-component system NtrC family response regulator